MARTPSTMLPLGTRAPHFALPDTVSGRTVSLDNDRLSAEGYPGGGSGGGVDALLVMFICNHCPYVKHIRSELARIGRDYATPGPLARGKRIAIVAINSNDPEAYPDDAPDKMAREAHDAGYTFPYLFDADQRVAHAYHAACTPDFFLFDRNLKLVYRGQLDDSRPKAEVPVPVTGKHLRAALDAVVRGGTPDPDQKPSLGCNIKWKPGNEPR